MANSNRDEFSPQVIDALARRASFICSNPDCRALTLAPSSADLEKAIYVGVAAHLAAAAPGGARHDPAMTPAQRASIDNAIFLCGTCSIMIDKNKGIDFLLSTLNRWKSDHEEWVGANLNKRIDTSPVHSISIENNIIPHGSLIINQNQLGGQVAHSITNVGLQPRKLSNESIATLVSKLKLHPPEEVDLLVANDAESHTLKEALKGGLLAAGWIVRNDELDLILTRTGIHIDVTQADQTKQSFFILLNWMHQAGLVCEGTAYAGGISQPRIYIGSNAV